MSGRFRRTVAATGLALGLAGGGFAVGEAIGGDMLDGFIGALGAETAAAIVVGGLALREAGQNAQNVEASAPVQVGPDTIE